MGRGGGQARGTGVPRPRSGGARTPPGARRRAGDGEGHGEGHGEGPGEGHGEGQHDLRGRSGRERPTWRERGLTELEHDQAGQQPGEPAQGAPPVAVRRPSGLPAGLVAHLGEIVSVVAADGSVLSVNHGSPDGAAEPGQSSLGWVHPDDRPAVAAALAELVADPQARTCTVVRVRLGDAGYRHMETTGVNRLDDPQVGGLVFVSRDVEDRVQLERRAARSLAAQRTVAELGLRVLAEGALEPALGDVLARCAGLLEAAVLTLAETDRSGVLRVTREHAERPLPAGSLLPDGAGSDVPEMVERGVRTTLEAALQGSGGPVGVLVAGWDTDVEPDEVDQQLLQGVANVLAGGRQREQRELAAVVRALHDPLTGLPTRPLLLDRLDHALSRAARAGSEVAVLLLDLDGFKEVNDRHGHAAGDEVLAALGVRLAGSVRPGDTAARLGGDEFVVLCEDVTDPQAVLDLIDRLREAVAEPVEVPGVGVLEVRASVGSAFSGATGPDRARLLQSADRAMYRDKRRRAVPPARLPPG